MSIHTAQVIGLGYIGLPTAALLASKGIQVIGVDIKQEVVDVINEGRIHIVEPDLAGLVHQVVGTGNLQARTEPAKADVFVIAVPTPFREQYQPDLTFVDNATLSIAPLLAPGNLVILESTSPVGTTERIAARLHERRPELRGKIQVAYCPERVLPGRILYELVNNVRIVGGVDERSGQMAREFYGLFVESEILVTTARTAEMCKLVENSYRDVNIAFANEVSMIAHDAGVDALELIRLANRHPRVKILAPGPGVGGHCIAVDPWFLVADFKERAQLIRTAREVNLAKTRFTVEAIEGAAARLKHSLGRPPVIACLGLSYKADIDDLRESPAVEVVEILKEKHHTVLACEPNIDKHPHLQLVSPEEALAQGDLVVLLVNHRRFKSLAFTPAKTVLDFCGALADRAEPR
jgi:UDP-N-acetyl-D-mannosaminuronic acid dehydrogenase